MPLPMTSTHHFHLRGHSANAHMFDEALIIGVLAPGEVINDMEIVLHGLGLDKASRFAKRLVSHCGDIPLRKANAEAFERIIAEASELAKNCPPPPHACHACEILCVATEAAERLAKSIDTGETP